MSADRKNCEGARIVSHGERFVMAPPHLLEAGCGVKKLAARLLLIYLRDLGHRPNWRIRVAHVQRALGISSDQWKVLRKQLEAAGYLREERRRLPDGKIEWVFHIHDWPQKTRE